MTLRNLLEKNRKIEFDFMCLSGALILKCNRKQTILNNTLEFIYILLSNFPHLLFVCFFAKIKNNKLIILNYAIEIFVYLFIYKN